MEEEDERLWPAFWRVFCRVMSLSASAGREWVTTAAGEMGGGEVVMGD